VSSGLAPQSTLGGGFDTLLILALPAYLAGALSLLSPCCLPILPAYFSCTFGAQRHRVIAMSLAFFLGLATTMVVLGASFSALGVGLIRRRPGLHLCVGPRDAAGAAGDVLRPSWSWYTPRQHPPRPRLQGSGRRTDSAPAHDQPDQRCPAHCRRSHARDRAAD